MTLKDIIEAIGKTLNVKTGYEVYTEWEENSEKESIYINCIDYSKEYVGLNKELLKSSFDIQYFPTSINESRNIEILEALEKINLAFDDYGKKYLKILDRKITIKNITSRIVDNIGHYLIDMEFYISYGEQKKYELMQELKLKEEYNE